MLRERLREHGFALMVALAAVLSACGSADAGVRDTGIATDAEQAAETGTGAVSQPLELVPLRVGGIEIQVEVADDADERQRGLMYRESLEENQGMLFVYPEQRTLGFWMKNTLIPLDIAYIDREGRIVDIQQMEPQTTETHDSAAPAMYALEMNLGWFEANGIRIGDLIEF
ncbi:DUF192 domain-containing protein [Candidatus Palauibacter soopunensis]|uniref:DUF192 domain-containing protein n=1 Tax=Candidatus Palauibacter soopunensis TaxID=3056739 RepID=UPI00239B1F5D|nr:DUF192 domain-containing protein [Candidatus Palauibacter soopunensis]MDE2878479.1 DUF192 domain-containing protein [Candidatus Palauibacter soopunensis]